MKTNVFVKYRVHRMNLQKVMISGVSGALGEVRRFMRNNILVCHDYEYDYYLILLFPIDLLFVSFVLLVHGKSDTSNELVFYSTYCTNSCLRNFTCHRCHQPRCHLHCQVVSIHFMSLHYFICLFHLLHSLIILLTCFACQVPCGRGVIVLIIYVEHLITKLIYCLQLEHLLMMRMMIIFNFSFCLACWTFLYSTYVYFV